MKKIIPVVVVVVVIAAGYLLYNSQNASNETVNEEEQSQPQDNNTSMAMYAEENAVIITDQRPGESITVNTILLKEPGYVVIHEDADGKPGAIIGSSTLLDSGEQMNIEVALDRAALNGESLHAMLHSELSGDSEFDATDDSPVQSELGGPIMAHFMIDSNAEENIQIIP